MDMPTPLNHYARNRTQIDCGGESRTEQSHKNECDINRIMDKFQKTGIITHAKKHGPTYGDVTGYDYQNAQYIIAKANSMYEELPSSIRRQFSGPAEFMDFVHTEGNEEAMREMGMLPQTDPEPAREPTLAPPTKGQAAKGESAGAETPAKQGETEGK